MFGLGKKVNRMYCAVLLPLLSLRNCKTAAALPQYHCHAGVLKCASMVVVLLWCAISNLQSSQCCFLETSWFALTIKQLLELLVTVTSVNCRVITSFCEWLADELHDHSELSVCKSMMKHFWNLISQLCLFVVHKSHHSCSSVGPKYHCDCLMLQLVTLW